MCLASDRISSLVSAFPNGRFQQIRASMEGLGVCLSRPVGAIGRGVALQSGLHELLSGGIGDRCWVPPVAVLVDLARGAGSGGAVFWIGRGCWPYPHALATRENALAGASGKAGRGGLLARSVFVDGAGIRERVWAAELAARSGAAAVVIADGTGLRMADSRRLQLAAESCKAVVLLARPETERGELSAARSRWLVEPSLAAGTDSSFDQQWTVTLLRCKGVQPTVGSARRWTVRREHATGIVCDWQACGGDLALRVADRRAATA